MKRIPEELDRLMWLVAEEQDSRAIEEFGDRYPNLRAELAKRLEMVRGLRGARMVAERTTIPAFIPRAVPSGPRWASVGLAAAACLALALVGYAGYRSTQTTTTEIEPRQIDTPVVRPAPEEKGDGHTPHQMEPLLDEPASSQSPSITEAPKGTDAKQEPKFILKLDEPSIEATLQTLARQAKVKFTIAPGMPEREVVAEFQDATLAEILDKLGSAHGFTALEQEEGHYLVIPARSTGPSR